MTFPWRLGFPDNGGNAVPKLFISYRRDDSAAVAGRLYDRLASHFGAGSVFIDVDSIPYGVDFRSHLAAEVAKCDVLLAVIAAEWLKAEQDGKRRLDGRSDFVRVEIESALARGIPVIPVLVGNVTMPKDEELPDSLRGLAFRNAAPLDSGRDFHLHVERLIRNIESLFAPPIAAEPPRRPSVPGTVRPHPRLRMAVAGLVMGAIVAAAVLGVVMLKRDRPGADAPPSATLDLELAATDPDRAVALWAFGLKAKRVATDEGKGEAHWGEDITSADRLPRDKFKLLALDFRGVAVGDADLARLDNVRLTRLSSVDLRETLVTDEGLRHLLPFELANLNLSDPVRITDAGARHIGQMKWLTYLNLESTGVTDEGLRSLEGLPRLEQLDLKGVKGITPAGVKRFKQANPKCAVEEDFPQKD